MQKVLFLLSELTDPDIDWLLRVARREEVPAGTILIQEGQSVDTLYILLDGTSVVTISALEGRQLAKLATGDVVGEMSFIDARPPSATVQTLDKSLVLAIPRVLLAEKLYLDVAFAARFYRALAMLLSYRLRGMVSHLGDDEARTAGFNRSPMVTSSEAIAQARFDRILNRLCGAAIASHS